MAEASASLPAHRYVWVDSSFIRRDKQGFEPAVWFGLHSRPGRAWGCHVLLECGAIYRSLPPHALAFSATPVPWEIGEAQAWDCYSERFSLVTYDYLHDLPCEARVGRATYAGRYLFTAVPMGDGYTADPGQDKEFCFIATSGGRLTIQPTNRVLFHESSFTEPAWPTDLRRSDTIWRAESTTPAP